MLPAGSRAKMHHCQHWCSFVKNWTSWLTPWVFTCRLRGNDDTDEDSYGSSSTDYSSDGNDKAIPTDTPTEPDSSMQRDARKAHKAAVKADNRERRKTKMPKHVKKRAEKKHKRK